MLAFKFILCLGNIGVIGVDRVRIIFVKRCNRLAAVHNIPSCDDVAVFAPVFKGLVIKLFAE